MTVPALARLTPGAATVFRALREAVVTMLAAIATLLCALAIDPEPGPAVLAVVLCISLSRSQLDRDRRGRIEAAIVLPAVGLVAVGVGALLRLAPWIGALVFIAGMFLSIWLRRFGPMARRAGSLIALPFVALLSTPYIPATRVSPALAPLMPVVVALLALLWARCTRLPAAYAFLVPHRCWNGNRPRRPAQPLLYARWLPLGWRSRWPRRSQYPS